MFDERNLIIKEEELGRLDIEETAKNEKIKSIFSKLTCFKKIESDFERRICFDTSINPKTIPEDIKKSIVYYELMSDNMKDILTKSISTIYNDDLKYDTNIENFFSEIGKLDCWKLDCFNKDFYKNIDLFIVEIFEFIKNMISNLCLEDKKLFYSSRFIPFAYFLSIKALDSVMISLKDTNKFIANEEVLLNKLDEFVLRIFRVTKQAFINYVVTNRYDCFNLIYYNYYYGIVSNIYKYTQSVLTESVISCKNILCDLLRCYFGNFMFNVNNGINECKKDIEIIILKLLEENMPKRQDCSQDIHDAFLKNIIKKFNIMNDPIDENARSYSSPDWGKEFFQQKFKEVGTIVFEMYDPNGEYKNMERISDTNISNAIVAIELILAIQLLSIKIFHCIEDKKELAVLKEETDQVNNLELSSKMIYNIMKDYFKTCEFN